MQNSCGVLGKLVQKDKFGVKVYEADLNETESRKLGKERGRYITLNTSEIIHTSITARKFVSKILAEKICSFLLEKELILVVGLGNAFLVADNLGSLVIKDLLITHDMPSIARRDLADVSALITGVSGINGFPTSDLVKSVVNLLSPTQVIVIDTFVAHDSSRLGTSFQISNTGISAGAGLGRKSQSLNSAFLRVPVLSIGVPLMMNACDFGAEENFVITPKEIDILARNCAKILSRALNLSLYGKKYFDYV